MCCANELCWARYSSLSDNIGEIMIIFTLNKAASTAYEMPSVKKLIWSISSEYVWVTQFMARSLVMQGINNTPVQFQVVMYDIHFVTVTAAAKGATVEINQVFKWTTTKRCHFETWTQFGSYWRHAVGFTMLRLINSAASKFVPMNIQGYLLGFNASGAQTQMTSPSSFDIGGIPPLQTYEPEMLRW